METEQHVIKKQRTEGLDSASGATTNTNIGSIVALQEQICFVFAQFQRKRTLLVAQLHKYAPNIVRNVVADCSEHIGDAESDFLSAFLCEPDAFDYARFADDLNRHHKHYSSLLDIERLLKYNESQPTETSSAHGVAPELFARHIEAFDTGDRTTTGNVVPLLASTDKTSMATVCAGLKQALKPGYEVRPTSLEEATDDILAAFLYLFDSTVKSLQYVLRSSSMHWLRACTIRRLASKSKTSKKYTEGLKSIMCASNESKQSLAATDLYDVLSLEPSVTGEKDRSMFQFTMLCLANLIPEPWRSVTREIIVNSTNVAPTQSDLVYADDLSTILCAWGLPLVQTNVSDSQQSIYIFSCIERIASICSEQNKTELTPLEQSCKRLVKNLDTTKQYLDSVIYYADLIKAKPNSRSSDASKQLYRDIAAIESAIKCTQKETDKGEYIRSKLSSRLCIHFLETITYYRHIGRMVAFINNILESSVQHEFMRNTVTSAFCKLKKQVDTDGSQSYIASFPTTPLPEECALTKVCDACDVDDLEMTLQLPPSKKLQGYLRGMIIEITDAALLSQTDSQPVHAWWELTFPDIAVLLRGIIRHGVGGWTDLLSDTTSELSLEHVSVCTSRLPATPGKQHVRQKWTRAIPVPPRVQSFFWKLVQLCERDVLSEK